MSEQYVAAKDCTILGVDYKVGQAVDLDMPPAYRKDLIDSGLLVPKGSQPTRVRTAPSPAEGKADGAKE